METDGLIVKGREGHKNQLSLTDAGRRIMDRQIRHDLEAERAGEIPHLLEETRRVILGSYAEGLSSRERNLLHRITQAVFILRHLALGEKPPEIVRRLVPDPTQKRQYELTLKGVHNIIGGERPWTNVTSSNMRDNFLPAIEGMEVDGLVEEGTSQWIVENILQPTQVD
jgi:hypothetical protein